MMVVVDVMMMVRFRFAARHSFIQWLAGAMSRLLVDENRNGAGAGNSSAGDHCVK